ncbi:MAG: hypothetical protein ACKVOL_05285 [Novosphingobium sp.]
MFSRIALLLILLVAVPYYWLLIDAGPTSAPPLAVDIAQLRADAARLTGPRPTAVEYAVIATETRPGTMLVAGGGLKAEETAILVWHVIAPGGDTVIDAGLTSDQAVASGFSSYQAAQQATVDGWLQSARHVLFTSEQIEHIGGLVSVIPQVGDVRAKVLGNAAQIDAIGQLQPASAPALPPPVQALSGPPGYAAVAPGISAMRSPGHLPGSQMIYVQLQDGREFLFTGDTAPMRRNVLWQRPQSRYLAEWTGSEDRAATTGWVKGLARLEARERNLTLVYGQDLGWLQDPVIGPHLRAAPDTRSANPPR